MTSKAKARSLVARLQNIIKTGESLIKMLGEAPRERTVLFIEEYNKYVVDEVVNFVVV